MNSFDLKGKKTKEISIQTSYDRKGNKIKSIQKLLNSYGGYTTTVSSYDYDQDGQRSKLTIVTKRKGVPAQTEEYNYFKTGNQLEQLSKSGKGILFYDNSGKVIKEEYYRDGKLQSIVDYEYDSSGRLQKKHSRRTDSRENLYLLIYTYFDSAFQRKEHLEYTTIDTTLIVSDHLTDINESGKPVKRTCLTDHSYEIFSYDQFGNETNVQTFDFENRKIAIRESRNRYWR